MPRPKRIPIIVAAGKGCRMGGDTKKQYLVLDAVPVLTRTIMVFDRHDAMDDIVVVIPEQDQDYCRTHIVAPYAFTKKIHLVKGGGTRQASVVNGLSRAARLCDTAPGSLVLIHDGVRPFVSLDLINRLMEIAAKKGGCIPALCVNDTLKLTDQNRQVQKTLDRNQIFRAQTPQVFRLDLIRRAYVFAEKTQFSGTDDASVMEHADFAVFTTPGSSDNIKLTTPDDLVLARCIMNQA
ncbi:MAG: 2-C-methyl-D-erythritol 4-phosphate cytidylyltransferase [Desulfotignum sp.]|jgi:2-C-methyl-D-erythritol 4-phosphate cytidylyltransferase|nr:2-C-methyl-D-erythritol 4-phosphate cytidylyltransferase [Desulfotignum sp.]